MSEQEWDGVKDSGKHQAFETGSVRDSREGKGRFDLIPPNAMTRVARHYENGAVKYGDRNWEKGQPFSRYLDSAMRHMNRYQSGWNDEDHIAAIVWNILSIMEHQKQIEDGNLPEELDDMWFDPKA